MATSKEELVESIAGMIATRFLIFWILCICDARSEVLYSYVFLVVGYMAIYVLANTRPGE